MCQRKRPTAQATISVQLVEGIRRILYEICTALHVHQLPHIEIAAPIASPAQENVGGTLGDALPDHAAPALVLEGQSSPDIGGEDRGPRLLHLKEKRVVGIDALKQQSPAAG